MHPRDNAQFPSRLPDKWFIDAERTQIVRLHGAATNFSRNVVPIIRVLACHAIYSFAGPSSEHIVIKLSRHATGDLHQPIPRIPDIRVRAVVRQISVRIVLKRRSRKRGLFVRGVVAC
jgi:hypothetical protein